MKQLRCFLHLASLIFAGTTLRYGPNNAAAASVPKAQRPESVTRVVDLKTSDGLILKACYFAAAKPGPGVLLLHQINRTGKAWDDLAGQWAAGIDTLEMRGFGESGGTSDEKLTHKELAQLRTSERFAHT